MIKVKWFFSSTNYAHERILPKWCELVASLVQRGLLGVKINDDTLHYFQTRKGRGQGDHLSFQHCDRYVGNLKI
jgi:hypothetical protein